MLFSAHIFATPAVANTSAIPQPAGYSPAEVLHAYGFDAAATSLGASGGDGSGQTIAIVEAFHSPTLASDVRKFDQQFALADPPALTRMSENGGQNLVGSSFLWSTETALDVEWAHAVAPKANIIVVEAKSADIRDLLTAVDTARHIPSVSIVSMSWGVNEFPTETAYDSIFTTPAGHQSVTFVASSGDTAVARKVQWPAASPNVVAVGGTTLTVSRTDGGQTTETSYDGAVSGVSQYESKPVYQNGATSAGARTIPDVVYDANPSPGFAVYNAQTGGWQTLGGTSSGAPQWAGLLALANQVRAESGKAPLNGSTQTLPALYDYYNKNHQATVNTTSASDPLPAGALLSDSGTPQAGNVITALVNNATSSHASGGKNSGQSLRKLLSKLPRQTAHPYILNVPAPAPLLRFPAPFAAVRHDSPPALQEAPAMIAAVVSDRAPVAAGTSAPLRSTATALLAIALPGMTSSPPPQADPVATLMASIYGEISALGADTVVPVGVTAIAETGLRTSWFVAHVNIAATFGDALAVFADDCASLGSAPPVADPAQHTHARAWMVTVGALAFDGLILYFLAPRPRRSFNSDGDMHWLVANG